MRIFSFLLFLTCLSLTGCGFHLRGCSSEVVSLLKTVYIQSPEPYAPQTRTLSSLLKASGVKIATESTQAPYTLEMQAPSSSLQSAGYGFSNQVSINTVVYRVPYRLLTSKGKEIIPWRTVTVVRNFTINTNQALMGNVVPSYLLEDMRRDAANQIIMQLNAWKLHETQTRSTP